MFLPANVERPSSNLHTGNGGPKTFRGEYIEGSFRSHQVPLPGAKSDPEQLNALQSWLESYKPHELFDRNGSPIPEILDIIPTEAKKIGLRKEANQITSHWTFLTGRDWPLRKAASRVCMSVIAELLHDVIERCLCYLHTANDANLIPAGILLLSGSSLPMS